MSIRLSPRDLMLVVSVVTVWGFTFVPIRWALDAVPPFALAALRFAFAAVPAVFFIRRPPVSWGTLIAYGFAIGVFQFGFLFLGMKLGMPAGLSSLVIQMQVFFTIGLAAWWLHDQLSWHSMVGAGIATAGIGVLAMHKFATGASVTLAGFGLVIAAALAWAFGNVIAKRAAGPSQGTHAPSGGSAAAELANEAASVGVVHRAAGKQDVDMLGIVVWASLTAPLPLALASYLFEGGPAVWDAVRSMTWKAWACVLVMSYFATLFSLAQWNALLHRYPTAVIAPFALLIPVSGLVSGALFLGEGLAPLQFAGAALVLAGLGWNVFGAQARDWLARSFD